MKQYTVHISTIKHTTYMCMVKTLSYISPTNYLLDIANELREKNLFGKVLFDLDSMDNGDNRFVEAVF